MSRVLRALVATALVIGPVVAWAGPAHADLPDRTGWWWQANSDTVAPLGVQPPAPPDAPQGGLYVAGSKAQPLAIGAVHLTTTTQGGTATLTLHAANSGFAAAPGLIACPTHSYWAAVEAGPWSQAPKPECDAAGGGVAGTASTDGSTMTWKLTSAFEAAPGEWNVVVMPSDAPAHVAIDPPGGDAFAVSGGAPVDGGAGSAAGDTPLGEPAPDLGAVSPTPDLGTAALPSALSMPSIGGPVLGAAPVPSAAAGAPAPAGSSASQLAATPAAAALPRVGVPRGKRVTAVVLLLVLAVGLWWLGGAPASMPRRLGALAAAAPAVGPVGASRGIGRFARPRGEKPPRL